jgi:hypothetical protein
MSYLGLHRTREAATVQFDDTTTGGMPGSGGTPERAGRTGGPISWPRVLRDAEGNQSGANGGSGGGTGAGAAAGSGGSSGSAAGSGSPPPTGDGEKPPAEDTAGLKSALAAERQAAKEAKARADAAEQRLTELEAAGQSDQEKSITQARREGAAERDAHWKQRIRAAEVRGALRGGGIVDEEALELALGARQFRDLKVDSETGSIDGLPEAVESFRKTAPWAFKTEGGSTGAQGGQGNQGGPWGGAEGGNGRKEPETLTDAIAEHYANPKR